MVYASAASVTTRNATYRGSDDHLLADAFACISANLTLEDETFTAVGDPNQRPWGTIENPNLAEGEKGPQVGPLIDATVVGLVEVLNSPEGVKAFKKIGRELVERTDGLTREAGLGVSECSDAWADLYPFRTTYASQEAPVLSDNLKDILAGKDSGTWAKEPTEDEIASILMDDEDTPF